jgi:hypothetical protein
MDAFRPVQPDLESGGPLKLFWMENEIGVITAVVGDFPWMSGQVELSPFATGLSEFFDFMVDEDAGNPPFAEDLLLPENWWVLDSEGARKGIDIPAVYRQEGTISWRWR